MLITRLGQEDIARAVGQTSFQRGSRYWRAGRVLSVDWQTASAKRLTVEAAVRGSDWKPYELHGFVDQTSNGSISVEGFCSCPVVYNCKHLAAALLAVIAEAPRRRPALPLAHVPTIAQTLSPSLDSWVDQLTQLEKSEGDEYPPDIRQRLLYLLDLQPSGSGSLRLYVSPVSVRLLKDGSFSTRSSPYNPANALQGTPSKFLRPADRTILLRLELHSRASPYGAAHTQRGLAGEEGAAILEAMLATGRARWRALNGLVARRGEPRPARFAWRLGGDAAFHASLGAEGTDEDGGPLATVCLAPPWYVDEGAAVLGPLETGLGARIAEAVLGAPPLPVAEAPLLQRAISERLPRLAIPEPPETPSTDTVAGPPIPRLTLTLSECPLPLYSSWRYMPGEQVPCAKLSFIYGPAEVKHGDPQPQPLTVHEGAIIQVMRDQRSEHEAEAQLQDLGFVRHSELLAPGYRVNEEAFVVPRHEVEINWHDLLYHHIPKLQEDGWELMVASDFPTHLQLARPDSPIEARLTEGSGIDWFDLDIGIHVDGERVSLLPALLDIITAPYLDRDLLDGGPEDTQAIYVPISDGRTLAIPASRVQHIARALYDLFEAGLVSTADARVRFSPFDAAALATMEAVTAPSGVAWEGGERLRRLGERLRATGEIPHTEAPASFAARLRPYQARGVDWLQFLQSEGFGAILADDMGLGKTVQTLAHLAIEKASGRMDRPALIVAPTSVVTNWRQEAARFAPALKVLVIQGPRRKERFGEISDHDLVITTYPLLTRDHNTLASQEWHVIVLDEAQAIKNPDATTTQRARELQARQRICLSGTPIENHLGELWSLFAFLAPGFLGDRKQFNRAWRRPIEVEGQEARRRQLARRVRPFVLRRTKGEVAAELPPKSEIIERVEMQAAQRDLYESVRLAMHDRVRQAIARQGLARSHIVVLDALLKLRQVCCDPRLVKLPSPKAARAPSAKLERLMEMLPELLEEGRRILLFSQFTSMLALIEEQLREREIAYTLLTGDTRDRETPISTFQSGEVPLFLVSLKAGGVGLNLTAADTVIHYDPWWNPAVEEQATDRAHRIGQEKPVFVYRLVTLDSIEEKMETLKERKRSLAAGIFDPVAGSPLELTEADVEQLFARA